MEHYQTSPLQRISDGSPSKSMRSSLFRAPDGRRPAARARGRRDLISSAIGRPPASSPSLPLVPSTAKSPPPSSTPLTAPSPTAPLSPILSPSPSSFFSSSSSLVAREPSSREFSSGAKPTRASRYISQRR
ncbi:hypothetical protein PUN28_002658 [Cardiocondyla obscurior]|uniref:Uncharacterized protein n=1 Tax=Cardiocondyla obscurior TaxID=286306 RepID=A0AAW2GVD4_9HYME